MFGDNDPEIAGFFAKFLKEGPQKPTVAARRDGRLRPSRYAEDQAPITNGLALGLTGAAAILTDAAAPRRTVYSERTEAFHRMLEEMANDIMLNGPHQEVAPTRPGTSRSSAPDSPVAEPFEPFLLRTLPPRLVLDDSDEEMHERLEVEQLEQTSIGPSEEAEDSEDDDDAVDVVDANEFPPVKEKTPQFKLVDSPANVRFQPTDFGASGIVEPSAPSNAIRVSVQLDNGKKLLNDIEVDLDSSMEDLFAQIELTSKKRIGTLETSRGVKLERSELPLKWCGLQDGDNLTAAYEKPKFQVVKSTPSKTQSLASTWMSKNFSSSEPVTMGGFGDTIARNAGADIAPVVSNAPSLSSFAADMAKVSEPAVSQDEDGGEVEDAAGGGRSADAVVGAFDLTAALKSADLSVVPPIPPSSEESAISAEQDEELVDVQQRPMQHAPNAPDVLPDEFDDLPSDLFAAQHSERADVQKPPSRDKSRPTRKAAVSPPPPTNAALATATPTSSRIGDLAQAPTPSRRSAYPAGPPTQPRGSPGQDPDDFKRKLEEKQRQNDSIWATIAATLEPAKLEPTKRSLLSHTSSAGKLGKKFPPAMSRTLR